MKKILFLSLFIVGLVIFCYPFVNGFVSEVQMEQSIETFNLQRQESEESDAMIEKSSIELLREEMEAYNEQIYQNKQAELVDPFSYEQSSFDLRKYGFADNLIGYVTIPKMEIELPIYLGANPDNLEKGAVHLSQTSLPLGGENRNTVIAAHRGWRGKTLFKNINRLTYGDEISITNLWETITYEVVDIQIVWPDEIDKVLIQDGRDLVTLMTCHPYGKNSQRYLVYLERVEKTRTD